MSKYTPGKWEVRYKPHWSDLDYWIWGMDKKTGGMRIADVVNRANARLIAAAPELLEALKKMLQSDAVTSDWVKGEGSIYDDAEQAIAKAEEEK